VDGTPVVVNVQEHGKSDNRFRGSGPGPGPWTLDAEQHNGNKTASRDLSDGGSELCGLVPPEGYGLAFRKEIRGQQFAAAAAMITNTAQTVGMLEGVLNDWLHGMTEATTRNRLHGWRLWEAFCTKRRYSIQFLISHPNPSLVVAEFVTDMN
jgi:hypothetical protein